MFYVFSSKSNKKRLELIDEFDKQSQQNLESVDKKICFIFFHFKIS